MDAGSLSASHLQYDVLGQQLCLNATKQTKCIHADTHVALLRYWQHYNSAT